MDGQRRKETADVASALAERGVAAASIEFRNADEAAFPGAVLDVKAAIRWMRANAGTILRGDPDATSDIDLWVVHLEPVRQRLQKFFNTVPVEIFVNPPWTIETYFVQDQANARPISAHMMATGHVILASDPISAISIMIQQRRCERFFRLRIKRNGSIWPQTLRTKF
jgi:predicted nucleotidyltransferase